MYANSISGNTVSRRRFSAIIAASFSDGIRGFAIDLSARPASLLEEVNAVVHLCFAISPRAKRRIAFVI